MRTASPTCLQLDSPGYAPTRALQLRRTIGRDHGIAILDQPPSVLTRSCFQFLTFFKCHVLTNVACSATPETPRFWPCVTFTTTPVVLAPTHRPAAVSRGSRTAFGSLVLLYNFNAALLLERTQLYGALIVGPDSRSENLHNSWNFADQMRVAIKLRLTILDLF